MGMLPHSHNVSTRKSWNVDISSCLCHVQMALNRASNELTGSWLSQHRNIVPTSGSCICVSMQYCTQMPAERPRPLTSRHHVMSLQSVLIVPSQRHAQDAGQVLLYEGEIHPLPSSCRYPRPCPSSAARSDHAPVPEHHSNISTSYS